MIIFSGCNIYICRTIDPCYELINILIAAIERRVKMDFVEAIIYQYLCFRFP